MENHPLWAGICQECIGVGCGLCLWTGIRQHYRKATAPPNVADSLGTTRPKTKGDL